ncbi:hypothetical protein Ctob_006017, partial [Chrysochromulina tobinii]
MSCSISRSVISSRRVGTGCPSRRHRREQRTRCASARQDLVTPLSSANVATSTRPRAASIASAEKEGCCSGSGGNMELAGCCGASTSSGTNAGSAFGGKCSSALPKSPPAPISAQSSGGALAFESGGDRALDVLECDRGVEIEGVLDELDELEERMLVRARPRVVWVVQLAHHLKRRGHDRGHGIDAILGGGEVHQILQGAHESGCVAQQRDLLSASRSHAYLLLVLGLLRRERAPPARAPRPMLLFL